MNVVADSQKILAPVSMALEDQDLLIDGAIKQVFGNAYVMESERAEFAIAESKFRMGEISMREFVFEMALSGTYKRRFFECCGPYRFVELNMKHLLGRAPISQAELSEHVQRYVKEGYAADIESYIYSDEYTERFGEDTVPFQDFRGTYMSSEDFNRMVTMYSAPGTSDKSLTSRASSTGVENPNAVLSLEGAGRASKMVSAVAMNGPSGFASVAKGLPTRPDLDKPVEPTTKKVGQRVEVVPGSYMYLSGAELEEYETMKNASQMLESRLKADVSAKLNQLETIKQELAALGIDA
eukprot:CAMPEP_0185845672 /NCGR_PEP_ID=MMETSP1354-20130828/1568_1 /TAXON_ID=708628 /ORGANISM="Erythrolobus madagascarensis, Strain CCMP3276" /LENGTH=295 /DNA_ID=CAMNT_0028545679 /DNA_START=186 /DNA_END=1073 /DNA_ORIENTATION=-